MAGKAEGVEPDPMAALFAELCHQHLLHDCPP
jgi:hypothetical protein